MIILELLYCFSVAMLAVYGLNSLLLTGLFWRRSAGRPRSEPPPLPDSTCPRVTVQLPVYNERHVVRRLVEAVARLEWPADRLQIQVLDDSTDDTRQLVAAVVEHQRSLGVNIEHIHRRNRQGFKAGALQAGLTRAEGEFIAIFDADFIPPPDFLQKTIPLFTDPRVGCVQTRWGHVNPEFSLLTRAQALGIDGHFVVEQTARWRIGTLLNFNGTAGVWRRVCMDDAGGWQGDTLTEDLDLSYRAQLKGWRIAYLPHVVTPAELPVQIDAFKRQQFRWAKGSIQTARKLMGRLWRSPYPGWVKLLSILHLTNYMVHPMMLLNLLLILPMMFAPSILLWMTPLFTFTAIGPPLLYWTASRNTQLSSGRRLGRLAALIALGTGLSVNNTLAVGQALLNIPSEFQRTPKFAVTGQNRTWQKSTYALPRTPTAWIELLLALYSWSLLVTALLNQMWWVAPWVLLYAAGYTYVSGLAFVQAWQRRAARTTAAASASSSL